NLSFADLRGALISHPNFPRPQLETVKLTGANWWDTKDTAPASSIRGTVIELRDDVSPKASNTPTCSEREQSSSEEGVTKFTILYCPLKPEEAGRRFEALFPRQKNEQAREEWLKAQSAL